MRRRSPRLTEQVRGGRIQEVIESELFLANSNDDDNTL
jgi:hypothetical protein